MNTLQQVDMEKKKRKHLQTLQPSAINSRILVGCHRTEKMKPQERERKKRKRLGDFDQNNVENHFALKTYERLGPKNCKQARTQTNDVGVQTNSLDYQFVTADEPPPEYWKQLAEQRRIALAKTLEENESLHIQLEVLETENSELRKLAQDSEKLISQLGFLVD